jgi:hypothetical protein
MTKKENISYQRQISDITDGLLIDAYRFAMNEVDRIHRDILWSLREKIDGWFETHPEKND